jgi:hypothetical protein
MTNIVTSHQSQNFASRHADPTRPMDLPQWLKVDYPTDHIMREFLAAAHRLDETELGVSTLRLRNLLGMMDHPDSSAVFSRVQHIQDSAAARNPRIFEIRLNALEVFLFCPELEVVAVAPELEVVAVAPELEVVAVAPELEVVAVAPEPEVVAVAPEPEVVAVAPEPTPTATGRKQKSGAGGGPLKRSGMRAAIAAAAAAKFETTPTSKKRAWGQPGVR